jgi:hypothetical protein
LAVGLSSTRTLILHEFNGKTVTGRLTCPSERVKSKSQTAQKQEAGAISTLDHKSVQSNLEACLVPSALRSLNVIRVVSSASFFPRQSPTSPRLPPRLLHAEITLFLALLLKNTMHEEFGSEPSCPVVDDKPRQGLP